MLNQIINNLAEFIGVILFFLFSPIIFFVLLGYVVGQFSPKDEESKKTIEKLETKNKDFNKKINILEDYLKIKIEKYEVHKYKKVK